LTSTSRCRGPQAELVHKFYGGFIHRFYGGFIPDVVVLDRTGAPAYNSSGEVDAAKIAEIFDHLLK
jgi:hypothetical protein